MMPGVNCSVLDCGSCRRSKGIGIFKLPVAKDEAHRKCLPPLTMVLSMSNLKLHKTKAMDNTFIHEKLFPA